MKEISRRPAPACVSEALRETPTLSFNDLKAKCGLEIRTALLDQQKGLCAFCCARMSEIPFRPKLNSKSDRNPRIAHIEPQSVVHAGKTDFRNFALSCNTEGSYESSCDDAQGNQELPVSPFTPNVQNLFIYKLSGEMEGLTDAARRTIRILNLDSDKDDRNHRLRVARRNAIQVLLKWTQTKNRENVLSILNSQKMEPLPAFQPTLKYVFENLHKRV